MAKVTPSFVLTLPLKTKISDESALDKYFELSRRYYNAILGKLRDRYYLMKQSRLYRKICKMPKGNERTKCLKKLKKILGYRGQP